MKEATRLNCSLRGSRTYVQGSQMIGAAATWLESVTNQNDFKLTAAKFLSLTDRQVSATLVTPRRSPQLVPASESMIGEVRFSSGSEFRTIRFHEISDEIAPRASDVPSRVREVAVTSRLTGTAAYEIEGSLESFMAATIEFTKQLHNGLDGAVADIWFTSIASAELPTGNCYSRNGTMSVDLVMERLRDGRLLTLSQVTATDVAGSFNIGFSCRVQPYMDNP